MQKTEMSQAEVIKKNRWYVAATIFGEQTGETIDTELHDKNRAVWNALCLAETKDPAVAGDSRSKANRGMSAKDFFNANINEIIGRYRERMNNQHAQLPSFSEVPNFDLAARNNRIHLEGLGMSETLCMGFGPCGYHGSSVEPFGV